MNIQKRKIVIIGAGHVGSHAGYALISQGLAEEIVYIDVDEKKAVAQALDLYDSTVYLPRRAIVRAGDYSDAKDALLLIVAGKALLGVALGYLADLLLHPLLRADKDIHSFCEREHCACDEEEGNVFVSALKHTVKIALMLVAVNIALNLLFSFIGVERLSGTFLRHPLLGSVTLALFGLIPNCSVSVVLTQTYLSGVIGVGGLFAGLLSNAGIGLLVLYRTNRNTRENLWITGFLFAASAASGIVITLLSGLF